MSNDKTFITNENEDNTLLGRLKTLLNNTKYFDVLVGYFFSSGFYSIYKSLEDVKKVRILIGINTDQETYSWIKKSETLNIRSSNQETGKIFSKQVIDEMSSCEDSIDVENAIFKFIEWLHTGKLEIRVYPYEKIHAKVYIMKYKDGIGDDGRVITGSSNFTRAGLNHNLEFNVELKNSGDYEFAQNKFEELWADSIDVSEEYIRTIKEDTWLNENITPYELYIKFLYEFLKEKINLDQPLPGEFIPPGFLDLQYQREAVVDAKSKLNRYGGVFLSDVVGLGKTYISALLAQQLDGKTLIIAPPVLLEESNPGSWPNVFEDFGVRSWKAKSWGSLDKLIENGVDDYKNVFIDEAHLFRNTPTQRYAKLAQICRGKRVILISATPLNNSPNDIYAQLCLFQRPNKSMFTNAKNLTTYFNKLNANLNGLDRQKNKEEYIKVVKSNSEKIRRDILREVMVRRTRSDIERYFSEDLEKKGLSFLEVNDPIAINYEFNEKLNKLFDDTLEKNSRNLKYARYMPLLYLTEPDPEVKAPQTNMGKFMKMLLVKRLESSFFAFKMSIKRFIKSYEYFIKAIDEDGYVYFSKKDMDKVFEYLENDDEESMEKLLKENKAERKKADLFDDQLLIDLNNDLNILQEIERDWLYLEDDPKLSKFENILYHDENLKNKIIVFTESKETAEYITNKLNPIFNNKVLCFTGSSNESLRKTVIDNFDAKSRTPKDDYRILVTTDVLAEGVNLHRSNVVINYDLPWNPTKMMQRVGRVQRVGSEFKEVYIYNFFPTVEINEGIGLEEAAEAKINAFIEMLGNDSKLLTDEESITGHELFEKLNSKQTIIDEEEEEDSELAYLKILREIRDNDKEFFNKIKNIPKKARSAKKSSDMGLLTFVRKGDVRKIYLNNGSDILELDLLEAAELLKCDEDTPREKIKNDFYKLLNSNKIEFQNSLKEDHEEYKLRGRGKDKLLFDILSALDTSRFTDDDEQYVVDLQNALLDGLVPPDPCKRAYEKLNDEGNFDDSLLLLNIIRNNIPREYVYYCPVTGAANTRGRKEVILSEYLIGDLND